MDSLPIETYKRYAELINQRIQSQQHLTEDSVRYSFFFAVLQTTDVQQDEIILELPHPKFDGKEIDTYILAHANRPEMYFEFKFHRTSKSTSPKPQKAGSLFKDVNRLSAIKSKTCRCFVIYLTCSEMAQYFVKNERAYSNFWSKKSSEVFTFDDHFVAKTTDTFRKTCGDLHRATISVAYSAELSKGYHLRILEINEI